MQRERNVIDLRSDTVTRPTRAMLAAMAEADVGDDGYGDDPTVNTLEGMAAEMLGKDAAMLVPSGTMGNLCAVFAQTARGEEAIVEAAAHIYRTEQGGMATLAGVPYRVLAGDRGAIPLPALEAELHGSAYGTRLRPALLCLETSHNAAGGAVLPLDYLASIRALASRHGLAVHIDGARVFNAAVALGVPASQIAGHADTVTFCLSKGLSAPVGSVLCGPREVIARARLFRKMLGGGMRQAGVFAAAGIVALQTMVERLAEDHARARRLAEGLAALHPSLCDPARVETNILFVDVSASVLEAPEWSRRLHGHGVVCRPSSASRLRLVLHREIDDEGVARVLQAFAACWNSQAERSIAA